jgi:hypothetical protein
MPFMILLPNASNNVSSDWIAAPGIGDSVHGNLADDNGDTAYVKCNDNNESMIIEYANPSVAEANIVAGSYSVRFLSSGRSSNRRNAALVDIEFQVPSGFLESCSYDAHVSSHETILGIARASKPGGGLWQYSDIEALEMKCTKDGTDEVYLGYLALRVDYTEAVATNATFFGANF